MRRIADSTYRVQTAANQTARHLTRPSSAQSRLARDNRTADARWLIAADQSVRNSDLAAKVVDYFPEAIPVTARELEVIETYLNAALDEVSAASAIRHD